MAAAIRLGRSGICTEISPGYCDVIVRRVEALEAGEFRLAGDGRTFADVAAERLAVAA